MGKNQYVVPTKSGWAIKGENNQKATKNFDKKSDAVKKATEIAKNQKSELTILKKDGKIQNKNSFGNDPMPPRDRK